MGLAHPPALDMLGMRGVFITFVVAQDRALALPGKGLCSLTDPPGAYANSSSERAS